VLVGKKGAWSELRSGLLMLRGGRVRRRVISLSDPEGGIISGRFRGRELNSEISRVGKGYQWRVPSGGGRKAGHARRRN